MVNESISTDGGESTYFEVPEYSSQSSQVGPESPVRFSSEGDKKSMR